MPQQGLVYIEFTGIARLFFKKLYFFKNNSFLPFCTGLPLYFCEFLLIYNIANRGILQAACLLFKLSQVMPGHIERKCKIAPCHFGRIRVYLNKFLSCALMSRCLRGLFWQNLLLRPAVTISPGLILTKSLATPRRSDIDGAYFNKISCYAPLSRYRRGLSWQNLLLRPAVPISPGLILIKSLSAPRCSDIAGAYFSRISFCAPMF